MATPRAGPKPLRLFFALWPGDDARRELGRWARSLHELCTGRRVPTEKLHITLAFIGQIDAGRFDDIVAAARSVQPQRFTLRMDRPGYWTHNHIAWLGSSEVPPELAGMVGDLRAVLAQAGVPFDPKAFAPHVTLVREARPPREELPTLLPVEWPVNGFTLISTERDEHGPYYRIAAGPFES